METILTGIAIVGGVLIFIKLVIMADKSGRDYERQAREKLGDSFIYDPETGAKITLEQAESGNWMLPDEELKQRNKLEQRVDAIENNQAFTVVDLIESLNYKEKS
ncbi:MAG: hypothetical protein DI539_18190 [Flavobacterium psychrophilum]|nr:MAG: hypothetical protein DI539_18190 [Flavobacterium psychrophilum]